MVCIGFVRILEILEILSESMAWRLLMDLMLGECLGYGTIAVFHAFICEVH